MPKPPNSPKPEYDEYEWCAYRRTRAWLGICTSHSAGRSVPDLRAIVEKFEHGQVCRGVVIAIMRFGIFVDIGGVDGMVSAANASSWRFEDLVLVGQEVTVTVLDVDLDRLRISLSLTA
ncbi:hypothetical protein Hesp01_58550 [Herbidospora sp. NBRC 101105]|nr:hypothetical protein Hesp01_58550 [Herbidospora sp. NBRC 101105]